MMNKFIIIEITQSKFGKDEKDSFGVPYTVNNGFDTYTDAKKKLDALIELKDSDNKYQKTQYKILQIPYNSAFETPKLTA